MKFPFGFLRDWKFGNFGEREKGVDRKKRCVYMGFGVYFGWISLKRREEKRRCSSCERNSVKK